MNNEYQHLPNHSLPANTVISHNRPGKRVKITLEDPAFSMMTDFNHIRPFSITATATIEEANSKMIACGVRLLFVSESDDILQGIITYNDIFGEKPIRYVQENGGKRSDLLVQDIMTPLDQIEALQLSNILNAKIGNIVETFKATGRQHILVAEDQEDDTRAITGLFSSSQIEKRLRIKIDILPRATTFADVERALA